MKTMTCKQLGGSCDKQFKAQTFEEMAKLSKQHGTEMFHAGDKEHLDAMEKMTEMMNDPEEMKKWMDQKQAEFDSLSENKE